MEVCLVLIKICKNLHNVKAVNVVSRISWPFVGQVRLEIS